MTRFPALAIALLHGRIASRRAANAAAKARHRGDSATGAEVHLIQFRACGRRALA